jgi:WD40 repeat protein
VGHTDTVCTVDYSPDGSRIVTCSYDSTIRFWDTETGDNCLTICGDNESFFFLLYSPRGDQVVTNCFMESAACRISVWDVTTGERRFDLPDGNETLYDIASTPTGELIVTSGTTDYTIRLWDVRSGECLHVLSGHEQGLLEAQFSPLGNMIASTSSDRTVRIWDVVSGECLAVITDFRSTVRRVTWSHDSTGDYLVVACAEGSLGRWRVVMDGGQCRVQLRWRLTRGMLSLVGTNIQDAQGLSQVDRRLLEQRGAVGKPAELDAKESN